MQKSSFLILLFTLLSCSEAEEKIGMLDREFQSETERTITKVELVKKIDLYEHYDVLDFYEIDNDSQFLYITDDHKNRVLAINKNDFDQYHFIGEGKGNGKGEVAVLQAFDTNKDSIVMLDRVNRKLVYYSKEGDLLNEVIMDENISPHRLSLFTNHVIVGAPHTSDFVFTKMDLEGNIIKQFEEPPVDNSTPFVDGIPTLLIYEGNITNDDKYLFYSGYSESVIRAYNESGDLVYSINTIDGDYLNIVNYAFSDQGQVSQWSAVASFSSSQMAIWNDFLLVVKYDNKNQRNSKKIDIYNKNNGHYIQTLQLEHRPGFITVDDDFIYATRFLDGIPTLFIYNNIL